MTARTLSLIHILTLCIHDRLGYLVVKLATGFLQVHLCQLPVVARLLYAVPAVAIINRYGTVSYTHLNTQHPLDENLLKEINRRVTSHTLSYRSPEAIPGEYTTTRCV